MLWHCLPILRPRMARARNFGSLMVWQTSWAGLGVPYQLRDERSSNCTSSSRSDLPETVCLLSIAGRCRMSEQAYQKRYGILLHLPLCLTTACRYSIAARLSETRSHRTGGTVSFFCAASRIPAPVTGTEFGNA